MSDTGFSIESTRLIHQGAVVTTEELTVRTPEGDLISRQLIGHPGAVAVVAVHDGCVVLVEQYRAALDSNLLEIPAGKLDVDGENLATAARRELIEEVGLDPQSLHQMGDFATAAGFSNEIITVFATNDCVVVDRQVDGVEEEHSSIVRIPLQEIDALLVSGQLRDGKSLIGLFWAQARGLLDPAPAK